MSRWINKNYNNNGNLKKGTAMKTSRLFYSILAIGLAMSALDVNAVGPRVRDKQEATVKCFDLTPEDSNTPTVSLILMGERHNTNVTLSPLQGILIMEREGETLEFPVAGTKLIIALETNYSVSGAVMRKSTPGMVLGGLGAFQLAFKYVTTESTGAYAMANLFGTEDTPLTADPMEYGRIDLRECTSEEQKAVGRI